MIAEFVMFFALSWHQPNDWTLVERQCAPPNAVIQEPIYKGTSINMEEGLQIKYYIVDCNVT